MARNATVGVDFTGDERDLKRAIASVKREAKGLQASLGSAFDSIALKSKRAGSVGMFRVGAGGALGLGAGLVAGVQTARALGDELRVVDGEAGQVETRFRNLGAALISGDVVGAFKAVSSEIGMTAEQVDALARSQLKTGDLDKLKAEAAAGGFEKLAAGIEKARDARLALTAAASSDPNFSAAAAAHPEPGFGVTGGFDLSALNVTGLSTAAKEALLDAQATAGLGDDAKALKMQQAEIRKALAQKTLTTDQRLDLKEQLAGVVSALASVYDQIAADQKAAADDVRAAKDAERAKLKADAQKAADAQRAFAERMRDQAQALKDAALDALGRRQSALDTSRGLTDAKEALRVARQQGGAKGIQAATRDLQDARLDRQRFLLEGATVSPASRAGVGNTVTIGSIVLPNVKNAQQLLDELKRLSGSATTQSRGRTPGINYGTP